MRAVLLANDTLRNICFGTEGASRLARETFANAVSTLPDSVEWRIYDHCAAITRLYAIYEQFVGDMIRDWLALLPSLTPKYDQLADRLRDEHKRGVAKLLLQAGKGRYSHLSPVNITKAFYSAISSVQPYELLPDAFLAQDQNYRKETLENIFTCVSIPESWQWLQHSESIATFLSSNGKEDPKAVENELRDFINYRNEAAHGPVSVDSLIGLSSLLEFADFIERLCQSIRELVSWATIKLKAESEEAVKIARITEHFRDGAIVATTVSQCSLSVGDTFYICGQSSCYAATVASAQLHGVSHDSVNLEDNVEIGLKFNPPAKKHGDIYRVKK